MRVYSNSTHQENIKEFIMVNNPDSKHLQDFSNKHVCKIGDVIHISDEQNILETREDKVMHEYKVFHNGVRLHTALNYEQAFGFAKGYIHGKCLEMEFMNPKSKNVVDKWQSENDLILINKIKVKGADFLKHN